MRRLIESLPATCYPHLSLHDHLPLAAEYGLGGVHLKRAESDAARRVPGRGEPLVPYARGELAESAPTTGYRFLSPIFDSISKSGYQAAFSDATLRAAARASSMCVRWPSGA